MDKTMTTPMPASPFLSASDGLHPLSSVAVAPLAPPALGATAEISSAEPLSAGPAVVAGLNPGSMTTAGTNTAWVRDCDRIELQEIQSSDGGQRPTDAAPTLGNMLHRPSSLVASGQGIDPTSPSEAFTAVERSLNNAEAASAPLLELHEFLGAGVQAPRPIGPWPRGFSPEVFLEAIEEIPLFIRDGGHLRRWA